MNPDTTITWLAEMKGSLDSRDDPLYDAMRDAWFHEHGFFVLRIANDHIRDDLEDALEDALDLTQQALDDPDSIDDPRNLKGL